MALLPRDGRERRVAGVEDAVCLFLMRSISMVRGWCRVCVPVKVAVRRPGSCPEDHR